MLNALVWTGRQGRYFLIAGLTIGLLSPGLAEVLRPWIGTLVAVLLFVTGLRIGARAALGSLEDLRPSLARIGVLQTLLPLVLAGALWTLGLADHPLSLAAVLMLAAPSLTGAPNFAIMMDRDPVPGMRLLVLGTALFPFTAFPVLWLLDPTGGGALGAMSLSLGLLGAILGAAGLGFALRSFSPSLGTPMAQRALDGFAAILLAVVVVGLMSAVGPLLRSEPLELLKWLAVALSINVVLVVATLQVSRWANLGMRLSTAIYAGNRNIALFLVTLPDAVAAPLLVFVGCYQVPMYLTPVLLSRLRSGRI